jgi:hypothetical protein
MSLVAYYYQYKYDTKRLYIYDPRVSYLVANTSIDGT